MAIQDAVNLIKTACTQWNLGYDQSNRLDFRKGGETDCSALVILTCEQAGLLHGNNIRKGIGATSTGNMRANFQARGWQVLPNTLNLRSHRCKMPVYAESRTAGPGGRGRAGGPDLGRGAGQGVPAGGGG